ncbi:STAS domain-containing protein [Ramlibacter algicola]|uniref:STAS domain-containing protein n=1 Tax=Ramlibacter algicola TaxID=2795217 RepID=A0A934UTB7_9BURK|nr:STAS domain-containing protein [Ramlibacter algicola]MBK0394372.1 STAS domain-containing protein [Ramlibacter algicola]
MPKDDTGGGGLFSKVVKFVRSPGTGWTADEQDSDRDSTYSKQMLKEMIERKRRNDFVRKREFDMLRKMRRSEVMAGQDPAARPSFFQSSLPSRPDDRATTLKKIDEIEAQMSMQWWKNKNGSASNGSSTNFPVSAHAPDVAAPPSPAQAAPQGAPATPPQAAASGVSYARTEAMPLGGMRPPEPTPIPARDDDMGLDFTAEAPLEALPSAHAPLPPILEPQQPHATTAPSPMRPSLGGSFAAPEGASSGFSHSKVFALEVDEFAHDPELEEAAIRFANGDDEGAEAGLKEVLAPGAARIDHDETWLTLFDLYRATGQQDRFETAAIDFAGRFGRSAPQWISLPEAVGRMGAAQQPARANAPGQIADWTCPGTFGTQTLATLNASLAKAQQPWRLSWVKLNAIDEAALDGLARLFTQWAAQQVQLRFIGSENLERVLRSATPSGDKAVNPAWWKLRMEVLRVMHRPDEFELVALDYCVTYEVSPPSWESSRCEFKPLQADGSYAGGHTIVGEAFRDSMMSNMPASTAYGDSQFAPAASQQVAQVATVELAGQILGDAKDTIDLLDGKLSGADIMVISCARLIRIDFTAAGTLLNWVSARQAEGRQVQFADVHRLVAAFFNVIGISEHARVVARRD